MNDEQLQRIEAKLDKLLERKKPTKRDIPSEIPQALRRASFLGWWAVWRIYLSEVVGSPLTSVAAKQQLDKLAPLGVDGAIATIKRSIDKGWRGVFPTNHVAQGVSDDDYRPG